VTDDIKKFSCYDLLPKRDLLTVWISTSWQLLFSEWDNSDKQYCYFILVYVVTE